MGKRQERKSRQDSELDSDSGSGIRSQRLEELFREELNFLLDCEMTDRRLEGAVVTQVELSGDGARARVWFGTRQADSAARASEVKAALTRATGFMRARLSEALPLKRMPELRFAYDPICIDGSRQASNEH